MDLTSYKGKFEGKKRKITKEQELANQVYEFFNRRISYPRIMVIIKMTGYQSTYIRFNEVVKGNARNRLALFLWLSNQERATFKELNK